jgi:hypothetical protein
MTTQGESNVSETFSTAVGRAIQYRSGSDQSYIKSNLAGKVDKIFADYFLGIPFSNILIEFKDVENGKKTEKSKPLRVKLCRMIDEEIYNLSLSCHYFGWGEGHQAKNFTVHLSEYVSDLCRELGCATITLQPSTTRDTNSFLTDMFNAKVGLPIPEFIPYLKFLFSLTDGGEGGTVDLSKIAFPAQLYSFSGTKVMSTPIHTLAELEQMALALTKYVITPPSLPEEPEDLLENNYGHKPGSGGMFK